MNRSTASRGEEARRAAQAAMLKAKRKQSEALKERATAFASEAQKVQNLRALRLATHGAVKAGTANEAAKEKAASVRKRRTAT